MASKRADRKAGRKTNRKADRRANRKASPTSMLAPMIAMARHHFLGLIAVAFAVIGGSAMITAGLIVGETGVTSHLPADRLAAADILVSAPQNHPVPEDIDLALPERVTVPADVVDEIADVSGVEAAANDLSFALSLDQSGSSGGPDTMVEGHSWDVAAITEPALDGHQPRGTDQVVGGAPIAHPAGLEIGERGVDRLEERWQRRQDGDEPGLHGTPGARWRPHRNPHLRHHWQAQGCGARSQRGCRSSRDGAAGA